MLDGKKTFIVAALTAVFAVSGFLLGQLEFNQALELLSVAGIAAGIRDAINKT